MAFLGGVWPLVGMVVAKSDTPKMADFRRANGRAANWLRLGRRI